MTTQILRRVSQGSLRRAAISGIDGATIAGARAIVDRVRAGGIDALREYSTRFGERAAHEPIVCSRGEMLDALARIDAPTRGVLERVAQRIDLFARLQRASLIDLDIEVPGGRAGHTLEPMDSAGCYAPGGRYPLPSSVLMTAIAARAAGVRRVVVASPNASDVMLASAAIAGADEFLCAGGAHAIATLAYGVDGVAPCDVIVGPGNRWVTAAKRIVSGDVAIDMLAGPSELVVIADDSADPEVVAADLLAQAEHDPDATAGLITTSEPIAQRVDDAIERQLRDLPTGYIARQSLLDRGFACLVGSLENAVSASDAFAPEHLQLCVRDPESLRSMIRHAGAVFVGERTAEVFGDYGVGPNHTLPTGGAARRSAGLSVMHFLRVRTWIRMSDDTDLSGVARDAASMARIEGLEAHARAAEARLISR